MKKWITLLLALLPSLAAKAEEPLSVKVRESLSLPTTPLTIKDIVDPSGTDLDFLRRYGAVIVCQEQDDCATVDQTRLFGALFKAGAPVDRIQFRMHGPVKIEQGQSIEITTDVAGKTAAAIASAFGIPAGDIRLESASLLPATSGNFADYLIKKIEPLDLKRLAKAKLAITLENAEGTQTTHNLYGRIVIETAVITTTTAVAAGSTLDDTNSLTGRQKLTGLTEPLLSQNQLKDKTLKAAHAISKDQVLVSNDARILEIIKQGTLVTLSYNSGHFTIKTQGTLQVAGEIGSLVEVENLESKQVVTGRLVTKDRVEVASAR